MQDGPNFKVRKTERDVVAVGDPQDHEIWDLIEEQCVLEMAVRATFAQEAELKPIPKWQVAPRPPRSGEISYLCPEPMRYPEWYARDQNPVPAWCCCGDRSLRPLFVESGPKKGMRLTRCNTVRKTCGPGCVRGVVIERRYADVSDNADADAEGYEMTMYRS